MCNWEQAPLLSCLVFPLTRQATGIIVSFQYWRTVRCIADMTIAQTFMSICKLKLLIRTPLCSLRIPSHGSPLDAVDRWELTMLHWQACWWNAMSGRAQQRATSYLTSATHSAWPFLCDSGNAKPKSDTEGVVCHSIKAFIVRNDPTDRQGNSSWPPAVLE